MNTDFRWLPIQPISIHGLVATDFRIAVKVSWQAWTIYPNDLTTRANYPQRRRPSNLIKHMIKKKTLN
jgi:hypothetical protein